MKCTELFKVSNYIDNFENYIIIDSDEEITDKDISRINKYWYEDITKDGVSSLGELLDDVDKLVEYLRAEFPDAEIYVTNTEEDNVHEI